MSRNKLIAAYWKQGQKQTLRLVAEEIGVSYNTVRNWLLKFEMYESYEPNRGKKKVK